MSLFPISSSEQVVNSDIIHILFQFFNQNEHVSPNSSSFPFCDSGKPADSLTRGPII